MRSSLRNASVSIRDAPDKLYSWTTHRVLSTMSTTDVRDEASEEGSFYAYFGPEYRGRLLFFRIPVIEDPGRVDTVVSELYRLNDDPSAKTGETTRTAFLRKYSASLTSSYYFLP